MALVGITATPVAGAAQIRLGWAYPPGGGIAGVRVTRAERSYPATPDDGVVIADGLGLTSATDAALDDGVIYYYSLFPFSGSPRVYQIDRANRATALASLPSNAAARMFALLPRVYHRYDTTLPPAPASPADAAHGQLRRFLDLPGGQLDLFASVLAALRNAHDPSQVDGRLLPLLAAWLGWQNDFTLEFAAQRRDLRAAPSLYRTIAIVPTIEATVKRLIGAECRSKELVHNVLASNRPERLNWWARRRSAGGAWTSDDAPLSLDAAFDGRPALARAADGELWLAYHVVDGDRSTIWLKRRAAAPDSAWSPSRPVVYRPGIDRDPTAAAQGVRVWLIWSVYDRATQRWSLDGRIFAGPGGATVTAAPLPGDPTVERRRPAAIADATGGVWLFWMERPAALAPWVVKFSRHDGTDWEAGAPHAVSGIGAPAPADAIDDDLFAMFDAPASRIRLCWTRREPITGLGATRWRMFTRTKAALDPTIADWTAAVSVGDTTAPTSDHDDREPFAFAGPAGIELAFSSNRDGRFAIWTLPLAGAAALTGGTTASERAPAAFVDGAETFLVFRSNRGVPYRSAVYAATETVDQRYAGGTTADTRNAAKLALRRSFDDFQTYSYDAGRNGVRRNSDWYAHDTVGLYVAPTSASAAEVLAALRRLTQGLTRFMPATERAVFVPSADLTTETAIPGLDTDQL
jgi:phage tail-like protein